MGSVPWEQGPVELLWMLSWGFFVEPGGIAGERPPSEGYFRECVGAGSADVMTFTYFLEFYTPSWRVCGLNLRVCLAPSQSGGWMS